MPEDRTAGGAAKGVEVLDHLVYAVPDLAEGAARVSGSLGVDASPGGRHPGWGTANALIGLGGQRYLEIIGPDPDASPPGGPRPFGIDDLDTGRLVTWAVRVDGIDERVAAARAAGYDPGPVLDMSRTRPNGDHLAWRLTSPGTDIVPFLIDWGMSPHPTASLGHACTLVALTARHPDVPRIAHAFEALGVWLPLELADRRQLVAEIDAPAGRVVLT